MSSKQIIAFDTQAYDDIYWVQSKRILLSFIYILHF